jgi:RNA polymerase sigma-70 factor (ECF subfamily)
MGMKRFHRLLSQEIPRLRRYARALVRDSERADDLVQDTLVRAIAKEHLWEPGSNLRGWLFTVMHNQHVNAIRRAMREGTAVDIDQCSASLRATADPETSYKLREFDRALGRLCPEQRQVLLLVGLEGFRYEEVAAILGIPVGTVRSRISRTRDMLRRLLDMEAEPSSAESIPARAA